MSRSLTYAVVLEELQQVLHDLHDLSMYGTGTPFRGVTFRDVEFVWRDFPLSHWTVRIEPMESTFTAQPLHPQPLTEVLVEMEKDERSAEEE